MRAGRGALVDDGVLRVVEVNEVEPWRAVAQLYRLYTGWLEGVRGVRVYDARSVAVSSPERVRVDCDGEQPGQLPATYTVRPGVLRVRVGPGAPAVSPPRVGARSVLRCTDTTTYTR
jgi:diacylglycerol kinase family enzyme